MAELVQHDTYVAGVAHSLAHLRVTWLHRAEYDLLHAVAAAVAEYQRVHCPVRAVRVDQYRGGRRAMEIALHHITEPLPLHQPEYHGEVVVSAHCRKGHRVRQDVRCEIRWVWGRTGKAHPRVRHKRGQSLGVDLYVVPLQK